MPAPFLFISLQVATIVAVAETPVDIHRCAETKARNPALLAVVSIVLSPATDFDRRHHLRRTNFRDAISLDARSIFRPSETLIGNTSTHVQQDKRPVCVQPVFVLSPWRELRGRAWKTRAVHRDEWGQIIEESKLHRDVIIAPTMVAATRARAQVLMHVLEWCQQAAPWADYVVSVDASVHIHWARMIELFPPPVPQTRASHALWHLGRSDSSMDALFFRDPVANTLRQCADVAVSAFSRDLVRHMTDMPFATQILHALRHPFRMYRARCKLGTL